MRTPALSSFAKTNARLWLVAVAVSVAGLVLALAALALAVWDTIGRFGDIPTYFIVREWAASPTMLLLVFTILWAERLVKLHRSGHSRLARMRYSRPTLRLIGRAYQWLGLVAAWIGSSIALQRLADFGVSAALIVGVLTFGLSMWLLEGLSLRQALKPRDAGSDRSATGPVGA